MAPPRLDFHVPRPQVASVFDRWLLSARAGLGGVLQTMAKADGAHHHAGWSLFSMAFDALQLLGYALYAGRAFPWGAMPIMAPLLRVLALVNMGSATSSTSWLAPSLLFVSLAWIAATVAAVCYSARGFSSGDFASVLPLRFLRATARLTVVAFVPLASLLLSVYKCSAGASWGGSDWPCFGAAHATALALMTLLCPAFLGLTLVVSSVFLERSLWSDAITARAHGRVGAAMIVLKTGLTLLFAVGSAANPWLLHAATVALGVGWVALWLRFLPSYAQWVNVTWTALGGVFTWAALSGCLARLLADPAQGVAGLVFLLGAPLAACAAAQLAMLRFAAFGAVGSGGGGGGGGGWLRVHTLHTPYDVELRARYVLRGVMRDAQRGGGGASHAGGGGHHDVAAATAGAATVVAVGGVDGRSDGAVDSCYDGACDDGDSEHQPLAPQQKHGESPRSGGEVDGGGGGLGGAAAASRARRRARAEAAVTQLFAEAATVFPSSALLDLLRANVSRCFGHDPQHELAALRAGLAKAPAMDVRFLLQQARVLAEAGQRSMRLCCQQSLRQWRCKRGSPLCSLGSRVP